ncbi:putative cell cycle control protein (Cwf23) [Aspergillus clavatus NRRL 1]|uniref:Cell cycle control protein (Cwf23), putative n=1 Tax=Aspergillus clavatus (strain ATCC 1007 / CBS 513.65 / DSM 816 / NCTC 3887 / NRRL 1 / QM 1276 / 107) TaxID=344612 RepID=A1CBJ0_ASPCL|nr:cell cycle control protein (Cwf23), putative [Aspergillus clavatus NRRL 1]EAW13108.1 cell cycle control protein (Cwf23), putative [Aspergillus clavatus NRRL 1]
MASDDDLKAHAASNQDFYALLDISPAAAETEIRRAYRRTALKYHPDKIVNPTQADIDKFHVLQIAYDVLSDPTVRQLYDNAREARERKKREVEMMDAAKRKMREDLEARERAGAAEMGGAQRGVKRTWMSTGVGDDDAEEKLQREIDRIAEDGRRRRREAEERLKRESEEEERRLREEQEEAQRAADRSSQRVDRSQEGGTNIPELERAVKVRWVREGRGLDLDQERLISLFKPFGAVENTFMLKDKRQRLGDKREKKTVATGVVVFASIVNAHAAVLDSEKKIRQSTGQSDNDWALIDSVFWASGNAPDLGSATENRPASPAVTPVEVPLTQKATSSTTTSKPSFNFSSLKTAAPGGTAAKTPGKAPSFASFAATGSSKSMPSTDKPSTLSFQEATLMRLKNAQREKERKALEAQLAKEDEAADAAEAAAAEAKS